MNTVFLYIKVAVSLVISFWSTRLVLSALGMVDYGIFCLIGSLITILMLTNSSMVVTTQRFISFSKGKDKLLKLITIFNVSETIHMLIALGAVVLMSIFLVFFFDRSVNIPPERMFAAKKLFALIMFSTMLNVISCPYDALISANENFGVFSIIGIVESLLKLLSALLLQRFGGDKLLFWGCAMTGIVMVSFVVKRVYCHFSYPECKLALIRCFDRKVFVAMVTFAGWSLLYSVSSILAIQGFAWLLNIFFGAELNAARGIGNMMTGESMLLCTTAMTVMLPVITKFASNDNDKFRLYTLGASKYLTLLLLLITIPVIAEMPEILRLWLTKVPPYAVIFCRLSIMEQIIAVPSNPLLTAINAKGDIGAFQRYVSLTYILRLPLIYLCLKYTRDPVLAYVITLSAVAVMCLIRIYYAKVKCGLSPRDFAAIQLQRVLPAALGSVLVSALTVYFFEPSIWRLIATVLGSTAALAVLTYLVGLDFTERQWLRARLRRLAGRTQG